MQKIINSIKQLNMPLAISLLGSIIVVLIWYVFASGLFIKDLGSMISDFSIQHVENFEEEPVTDDTIENYVNQNATETFDISDEVDANEEENVETIVDDSNDEISPEIPEEIVEDASEDAPQNNIEEVIEKPVPYVPYEFYKPVLVKSPYYIDCGRKPATMVADYFTADDSYFDDACLIGDSRGMGISDYSGWENMDFFCDNGYCAYNYSKGKAVDLQRTGKKYTLEDAMELKQYKKVYIMLGINDCGYGDTTLFKENYQSLINLIEEKQKDAIIFLVGNMHISREKETQVFTNLNINAKNVAISECADGIRTFYLDFNELVTDDEGYLIDEYTFDGFHLYAAGYQLIIDYIKEHAISPLD